MLAEGQVVGPIRLIGRLGVGGMGEVWEGLDERLGRRVAVKAIRRSADEDPLARARFAREARILSSLEHPHVCRLYEYLHTDALDLLVLELVHGRPLGRAIAEGLTAAQKLGVALGVGRALLAAHALSVVHRDLKPDNVMLAEDGTVKVLDFGIARRSVDLGESPSGVEGEEAADGLTLAGRIAGTPRYMSPEQARGEPATAASDMFCFGLLLFELCTSRSAYGDGPLAEVLARAQWGDVPAPVGIDRAIAALIADLTRLEPSGRPTAQQALERLGAIEKRPLRRLKAAAAIVVATSLIAGMALSLVGLARARREAVTAQATTDFLVRLFQASDPQEAPTPEIRAREVLARGVARLRDELKDQPAIRARLLAVLGGIHGNLGLYREAEDLLEEALTVEERRVGPDDPSLLPLLGSQGNALSGLGELDRAETTLRQAVELAHRAELPAEEATALNRLAALLVGQRRLDEAEPLALRAVALREASVGADDPLTAETSVNLALVEIDRGHPELAEPRLARALATLEEHRGPDHPSVAAVVNNLASARNALARFGEAEALYRRALDSGVRRLGAEHPEVAVMRNDLAVSLVAQDRFAEAEVEYRRALATAERALGATHPMTAIFAANLGEALDLQGRAVEAEPILRHALTTLRAVFGADHPAVAEVLRVLGRSCASLGRRDEAERMLRDAVRIREATGDAAHPDFGRLLAELGAFYLDAGRVGEASVLLARAEAVLGQSALPEGHPARRALAAARSRLPAASGAETVRR